MQPTHTREVWLKNSTRGSRQHRSPIFVAFPAPDQELTSREVDVLNAQRERLEQAKAATVQQERHEERDALEVGEHAPDFVTREDGGKPHRTLGGHHALKLALDRRSEHVAIEEQQRRERLVLCRRAHSAVCRERAQKRPDFTGTKIAWVPPASEDDEAAHPGDVRVLRAWATVAKRERRADRL
jgi:hypothetical protein